MSRPFPPLALLAHSTGQPSSHCHGSRRKLLIARGPKRVNTNSAEPDPHPSALEQYATFSMAIQIKTRWRFGMDETSKLDEMQRAYKAAVEKWIAAIKEEEALASVNHSIAEVDKWEGAHFREDDIRNEVKA